jgi:hypothetical protein
MAGVCALLLSGSCTHHDDAGGVSGDLDASRLDGRVYLDASCQVSVESPPLLPASHVAIGTPVAYSSDPPSSGPHYPVWAAYQTWDHPVDPRYLVHNLEHGSIVFLYRCGAPGGCPDIVSGLEAVEKTMFDDPLCTGAGEGVRVRALVVPYPTLDVPVAAVGWGWIYRAACVDAQTLHDFVLQHYGQGPEQTCAQGSTAL